MSPFILQPRSSYLRERITRGNGVRTRAATTAVTVTPNRDDLVGSEEDAEICFYQDYNEPSFQCGGPECAHSLPEIASERVLLSARPHSSLPTTSIEARGSTFSDRTELCKAGPSLKSFHVDFATFHDSTCYLHQGQCNDSSEGWFAPSKSNQLADCDHRLRSADGHPRKILLPEL
jgi:hypothetical protein